MRIAPINSPLHLSLAQDINCLWKEWISRLMGTVLAPRNLGMRVVCKSSLHLSSSLDFSSTPYQRLFQTKVNRYVTKSAFPVFIFFIVIIIYEKHYLHNVSILVVFVPKWVLSRFPLLGLKWKLPSQILSSNFGKIMLFYK